MTPEEKNFQSEGGLFAHPNLVPLKFFLNYDPPQLGVLYKRHRGDRGKHLFLVQLNSLIITGDAEKITQTLYEKYPAFINRKLVRPAQITRLVNRLLDFIQNMINDYNPADEDEPEDDPRAFKKKPF